jgi:tRNA-specific 2-thiouridylase
MNDHRRVVVAMSGGVDSSVTAALLVERGFQVIGMMMRLWSETNQVEGNRCCTPDAMANARRVASILNIPFYAVDAQQIFHERVVSYFIDGYLAGITPNPCLVCNRTIRWEFLLERALAVGATAMATGHYVRLRRGSNGRYQLLRAVDTSKDQSYVLHVLNQEQLSQALFPLGDLSKDDVRQIARDFKLPVAERPDSQDLCFTGNDGYRGFMRRNALKVNNPGPVINSSGKILGEHKGLAYYTIGQRRGLGIPAENPLYVLEKNIADNTLVVGERNALKFDRFSTHKVNWISGKSVNKPFKASVKIRYKARDTASTINPQADGSVNIHLVEELPDITPGQAAVIYKGEVCLGGGIIKSRG